MREHELWNELGNLYFISGSYGHAVHAYERAIDLKPNVGEPYNNLALTYVQMDEYLKALDIYNRGMSLLTEKISRTVCLHKLGEVYLHLKRFQEASEIYQQMDDSTQDIREVIDSRDPSDLLLHCQPQSAVVQQDDAAHNSIASNSSETEMPLFVEELTPWWFDGQVEPEEAPEPDFDIENSNESNAFDHNVETRIEEIEPLIWEKSRSDQVEFMEENPYEESSIIDEEMTNETGELVDDDMDSEFLSAVVPHDNPDSDVVTESPEFSGEDVTSPEAIQYETTVDWSSVELSEEERREIHADINKLKQKLDINPGNATTWHALGGNYKTLGQYDDAIDAYQKAIDLDPENALYFHHLGLIYAAVSRFEAAIDAFKKVVEMDPNHSLAHATLGGYYRKNGDEELAREHIEKAKELVANDENEYNRACMEAICGNTDYSLELLKLALKNKQAYVSWARRDPDFDFIRSDPRFHALLDEYTVKSV